MSEIGDIARSGAVDKIADLLHKLTSKACDDIGDVLSYKLQPWKARNLAEMFKKTEHILMNAGLPPKEVPMRLFSPIVEASSIEDNETLQDLWAGLLATASQHADAVSPSFTETQKQLTPDEARHLEVISRDSIKYNNDVRKRNRYLSSQQEMATCICDGMTLAPWAFGKASFDAPEGFDVPIGVYPDSYQRLGLIRTNFSVTSRLKGRDVNDAMADEVGTKVEGEIDEWYEFTEYAVRFLEACHGPLASDRG